MKVSQKLEAAGFTNIVNVEGGTSAWHAAGLPVDEGKNVMSLERQVRIAAGSLVVIGIAIGQFVHPAGFGLSALIGAGLVFSAVTNTCGMGMMIAKMPLEPDLVRFTRLQRGLWVHQSLFSVWIDAPLLPA